jgi:hypothetical protein
VRLQPGRSLTTSATWLVGWRLAAISVCPRLSEKEKQIMRRSLLLLAVMAAGCSTAPVADMLDFFKPGKLGPEQTPPYGGVCAPTALPAPVGAPAAPAPALPVAPLGVPAPPAPAPTPLAPVAPMPPATQPISPGGPPVIPPTAAPLGPPAGPPAGPPQAPAIVPPPPPAGVPSASQGAAPPLGGPVPLAAGR